MTSVSEPMLTLASAAEAVSSSAIGWAVMVETVSQPASARARPAAASQFPPRIMLCLIGPVPLLVCRATPRAGTASSRSPNRQRPAHQNARQCQDLVNAAGKATAPGGDSRRGRGDIGSSREGETPQP